MSKKYLHSCSCSNCTNENNLSEKHIIEYSTHARLSRIHEPAFLDIKFFRHFYHVIWVENHQNQVYLFTGHPYRQTYKQYLQIDRHIATAYLPPDVLR